jgi:hypothetical protein
MMRDRARFPMDLSGFIAKWEVSEGKFIKYFVDNYANRPQTWAVCFRNPDMPDTTGRCESWHRVFKYKFMKGNQNIYVEPLLKLLMEAEESY